VTVNAEVDGLGPRSAEAAFEVLPRHRVPAPGEPAPPRESLTLAALGVPPSAIDSRALGERAVPDPELHQVSIADAVRARRPTLVVFATPTFCVSRFCGPVTDMVAELAQDHAGRAAFSTWRSGRTSRRRS
jgi:hypothetical protein